MKSVRRFRHIQSRQIWRFAIWIAEECSISSLKRLPGEDTAKVRIANYHTNIVLEEHNGEKLLETVVEGDQEEGLTDRSLLNMEDIWDFAMTCEIEDVRAILDHQIDCNMAIAKEGLTHPYGACIGQVMLDAYGNEIRNRASAMAAAGSDARMSGCELPVVINSGSGNQGITCSVPVIEYAKELCSGDEKMYRALALSNLVGDSSENGYRKIVGILRCGLCRSCSWSGNRVPAGRRL